MQSQTCIQCGSGFRKQSKSVKFCSRSCSSTYNNQRRTKKPGAKPPRRNKTVLEGNTTCLHCGVNLLCKQKIYCSIECCKTHQYNSYIQQWKNGEKPGVDKYGMVTGTIKKYLRIKFNNSCALCGWSKINPSTNKVPLVADHINGNWQDNREENLRLLCGACDSIQPTFGALNKGRGRTMRYIQ